MTRRDKCYLVGKRASQLSRYQRAYAWHLLAADLMALGNKDIPKFQDIVKAIRQATIQAKRTNPMSPILKGATAA